MTRLTIRDPDDQIRLKLRVRAAQKGVSMEAEVRSILAEAVKEEPDLPGTSRKKKPDAGERGYEPQSEGWVDRWRQRLAEHDAFWTDDEVDFILSLRHRPDLTWEEFRRERYDDEDEDERGGES